MEIPASGPTEAVPDDLSRLSSLEEDKVRFALSQRFDANKIYTHINALLVAINPYQMLPIYGQESLEAYNTYGQSSPGPHVFGVAAATYRGLLDARSQSVIISGESGAGKTEVRQRNRARAHSSQRRTAASPLFERGGIYICHATSCSARVLDSSALSDSSARCHPRARRLPSASCSSSHTRRRRARAPPTRCVQQQHGSSSSNSSTAAAAAARQPAYRMAAASPTDAAATAGLPAAHTVICARTGRCARVFRLSLSSSPGSVRYARTFAVGGPTLRSMVDVLPNVSLPVTPQGLEERVIATSPLLEAFGNAQTIMNNNSSRYGKYLMLQFDLSGKIMGASIKTYLLE
jgi:hypothetical protein